MGEKKHRELWDIKDLMEYTRIPKNTLRLHIALGKIPFIKIGRHIRFIPDDVERAFKKLST